MYKESKRESMYYMERTLIRNLKCKKSNFIPFAQHQTVNIFWQIWDKIRQDFLFLQILCLFTLQHEGQINQMQAASLQSEVNTEGF